MAAYFYATGRTNYSLYISFIAYCKSTPIGQIDMFFGN